MAKNFEELLREARELSKNIRPVDPCSLDALRKQGKALFDALPEPPSYRRAGDQTPARAEALIEPTVRFLAQLYGCAPDTPGILTSLLNTLFNFNKLTERQKDEVRETVQLLTLAAEAHLRALVAIRDGDIVQGDLLASEARQRAKEAMREGMRFRLVGNTGHLPVFDRATGVSRYDPADDLKLIFQISCPACSKLGQFDISAMNSCHLLTCRKCQRRFSVLIGNIASLNRIDHGIKNHYVLSMDLLGEGPHRFEFDDRSRNPFTAAPGDMIAFVYAPTKSLSALENLTTGAFHAVQR